MDYEGQICRAPMERGTYMLPVTVGCSYNRCRFCMLFKHLSYRELTLNQIEQELIRVKNAGGSPKRVFLGDGNAFQLGTGRLMEIIGLLRRYFPECSAVHMDATVTSIAQKSDAELADLARAGVRRLYLGIETGLDDVLRFMDKDHTLPQAYEQISRLSAQDIQYAAHIMTGIAGKGRGVESAEATARFFNETKPCNITNFSLFLHRSAPLYHEIEAGRYQPADEMENLLEERRLIERLQINDVEYDGFHDQILFRVRGKLPRDRRKMLDVLDGEIARRQSQPPVFAYVD